IDTTARTSFSASQARSRSRNASMPGPCSPMELSIPLGVSAIRGVGRPLRGWIWIDFVTTPPMAERSLYGASSRPAAAQPDAVKTGSGKTTPARSVAMSMSAGGVASAVVRIVTSPTSVHLHRGCPDGVVGHRAKRVPADPVPREHRTVDAGAKHAGLPVIIGDREHAGHTHAHTAGHGLLDRDLHRYAGTAVRLAGNALHGGQHRHRSARVDDIRT